MTSLQQLSNGHAPITMQTLFRDAVYAFDEWDSELAEPTVTTDAGSVPVSRIFEQMRGCDDILPCLFVSEVTARLRKPWTGHGPLNEMTFGTAARIMSVLARKKRLQVAATSSRTEGVTCGDSLR